MAERHFEMEQLDQRKLIKANDLKQITNPVMFNSIQGNTPDGLLSNEIFGLTMEERSGIFAYIDLNEYFINPYFYRIWLKIDKKLKACVYETERFKINSSGYLEVDPDGETGIKFLRKNIDKIKFKDTKKDSFLTVLMKNKDKLFTKEFIIIPPYYRDVNSLDGRMGVGEINKLYVNLMNNIKALSESNDYGLSLAGGVRGRIQDLMLEIYNWFTIGESANGEHTGAGIFKKFGVMRRSVMSKTTDNSCRLVLSAPKINVDSVDDLMVDADHCAIPLSAALVVAYPFIIYWLRQWFSNEFADPTYPNYDSKSKKVTYEELENPQIVFSDDRIDTEIREYLHGYSNRLKPIQIPFKNKNIKSYLVYKGRNVSPTDYGTNAPTNDITQDTIENIRDLTWVDLFYMAACDMTEDKMCIITRYPMDSYFNQFYIAPRIYSTINTEPVKWNDKLYRWYPKIRQEDIGADTSNMFIDTCSISNVFLGSMGADYDGDQVTVKMAYSVEANEELKKYKDSKAQFTALNGQINRKSSNEAIQSLYNLTLVLPGTELKDPQF